MWQLSIANGNYDAFWKSLETPSIATGFSVALLQSMIKVEAAAQKANDAKRNKKGSSSSSSSNIEKIMRKDAGIDFDESVDEIAAMHVLVNTLNFVSLHFRLEQSTMLKKMLRNWNAHRQSYPKPWGNGRQSPADLVIRNLAR